MSVKKNDPLRLDISYLVKQSPGTRKEFDFNFSQLELPPDLVLKDIQGKIAISVTEDGVVAEGDLKGVTDLECSRCLEEYPQPLDIQFTEIFSAHPAENTRDDLGEQLLPADGALDLHSIIRDYAILDIPIRHLCRQDCKGLCPLCGMNLNQEDCGHKIESIDPRLEGLKELLEDQEEKKKDTVS
jgi:uncharacterized protein